MKPAEIFLIQQLQKKAEKSHSKFRIAAFGFNAKGQCVAKTVNRPSLKPELGSHAEERLFKIAKRKGITYILIIRIGLNGNIRPIDPCPRCQLIADKLGIKIESIPAHGI